MTFRALPFERLTTSLVFTLLGVNYIASLATLSGGDDSGLAVIEPAIWFGLLLIMGVLEVRSDLLDQRLKHLHAKEIEIHRKITETYQDAYNELSSRKP